MTQEKLREYILDFQDQTWLCELHPKRRNRHVRVRLVTRKAAAGKDTDLRAEPNPGAGYGQLRLWRQADSRQLLVCVSHPWRMAYRDVVVSIRACAPWIARQSAKIRKELDKHAEWSARNWNRIPLQGQEYPLLVIPGQKRESIGLENGHLVCRLKSETAVYVQGRLEAWFKARARQQLEARAQVLALAITSKTFAVRIGKPRTRWGSCSSSRTLSFNWKLIMAPEYVLDYIVVHELSHLEEMNHSEKFWNLVKKHCPGLSKAKTWLKQHGRNLDYYQF